MQKQIEGDMQQGTQTPKHTRASSQKKPKGTIQAKSSKKPLIQAKQRPVNKSEPEPRTIDPFEVKSPPMLAIQRETSHQVKATPKATPQGSAKFQEIATAMGEQHGVDTSSLKATHNSSFPASVNAEATIQGNKIDFAPGKDSEHTMKHEVAHYIDNAKNGVPKGDKVVNGQKVDTTREGIVDKMVGGAVQRKSDTQEQNRGLIRKATTAITSGPIQRAAVVKRDLPLFPYAPFPNLPHWEMVAYDKDNDRWWQSGIRVDESIGTGEKLRKIISAMCKGEPQKVAKTKKVALNTNIQGRQQALQAINNRQYPTANGFQTIHHSALQASDEETLNDDKRLIQNMPLKDISISFHPTKKNCQTFVQNLWQWADLTPSVPALTQQRILGSIGMESEQIHENLEDLNMQLPEESYERALPNVSKEIRGGRG